MLQKLPIVKKAYEVKDPELGWEYDSPEENWQLVYAKGEGDAKKQCRDYKQFTDIRCRRVKMADIVLYEGTEIARGTLIRQQKENDLRTERRNKVMEFPETEMFYIQKGYVGNSCYWWALGNCGYTTDLAKAQSYTRKEVLLRFINSDSENKIWPASHVETKVSKQVDSQHLNYKYCA